MMELLTQYDDYTYITLSADTNFIEISVRRRLMPTLMQASGITLPKSN
jgi:hypothetical protein